MKEFDHYLLESLGSGFYCPCLILWISGDHWFVHGAHQIMFFFSPKEIDYSINCIQFIFVWLQDCVMSSPPDLVMEFDSLLLIVLDTNLVLSSKQSFSKFIFLFILSLGDWFPCADYFLKWYWVYLTNNFN